MRQVAVQRRRFLQIAAAVPLFGLSARAQAAAPVAHWRGVALGASSQIVLSGLSDQEAAPLFAQMQDEIARLEGIFSLYQSQSALSHLNATGHLVQPAPELLEVLSLSRSVWQASFGAFDPTVQPLWRARASGDDFSGPAPDFGNVQFSTKDVILRPAMALTVNGIAQGYITDRIATLLRAQGLSNLMVDAGEQRALGERPRGGAWQVGVADPAGKVVARLSLRDRALATSSPAGTVLASGQGHIIDARNGKSAKEWQTVSIAHDSAAVADALSTAACCLPAAETAEMLRQFPGASLEHRT